MSQLALNLSPRLRYQPESFVRHSGVRRVLEEALAVCATVGYRAVFIEGAARSGKTHLAFALADELSRSGKYPRVISAEGLAAFFRDGVGHSAQEVLILDDCHHYLMKASDSGEFVNQSELARRAGASLVVFSAVPLIDLGCDDHVNSRLRAGAGYELGPPSDEEVPELLESMARQRGLGLSRHKVSYLIKRIGRDIPAIERYLEKLEILSRARGEPFRLELIADAV